MVVRYPSSGDSFRDFLALYIDLLLRTSNPEDWHASISTAQVDTMLPFDGAELARTLRTSNTVTQARLLNDHSDVLQRASWSDLSTTGITEAVLEIVTAREYDAAKEVRQCNAATFWKSERLTFTDCAQ